MNRQIELVALWLLIITGFLAHTLADVMPAFWGESIVAMPGANNSCELISMMMGVSYTLPVLGVFLAYGADTRLGALYTPFWLAFLVCSVYFTCSNGSMISIPFNSPSCL